jgi:uncharacterized protein (DUF2336 family)
MINFVKNWIKRSTHKGEPSSETGLDYEIQKKSVNSKDLKDRITLASHSETSKEILYYLAEKDPSADVRKAVAENSALPLHATPLLARDQDQDVRLALAGRLVDLLPGLSRDKHSQLYAFAVQALGTLALDEVLKVRVALSSTLKDHAHTPPSVAGQLARDVEREVSEPILRFCAALSDDDLLDILKGHPASWAVEAIARRDKVSAPVSVAVIRSNDRTGGAALINNNGADLAEPLLLEIVEKARTYPEWQKPVASRARIPLSIAKALAEFVDSSVRDLLMARSDFAGDVAEEIAAVFRRRVDFASQDDEGGESLKTRIEKIYKEGLLNEQTISDALAMRDRAFVNAAIARILRIDIQDVTKIFEMKAAKPIVALAWSAGFSMRMALQLQKEMGYVPPKELIYPRDGTDYPLTEDDLRWQQDFLGLRR